MSAVASPSNPLGIKNLFLHFESVLHLPARGRNRYDNDVRFLAPNGKDFRIDKILA